MEKLMILASAWTAFIITVVSILLLIPISKKWNLVDVPGGRKLHLTATPLIGGIAMYLGFTLALFLNDQSTDYLCLFLISGAIVVLGIIDDLHEISAKKKFCIQFLLILLSIFYDNKLLQNFGDLLSIGNISLGVLAIPVTIFAAQSVINAINMIDGIDGLAGSLILFSVIPLLFINQNNISYLQLNVISALVGAIIGFLIFNFSLSKKKTAKIFMGDSGSMFLGFILFWLSISLTQGNDVVVRPVTFLWLLAIPLFDLLTIVILRVLSKQNPLLPSRDHLHHILQSIGLPKHLTLLTILFLALMMSILAYFSEILPIKEVTSFLIFVLCFIPYFLIRKHLHLNQKILDKFKLIVRKQGDFDAKTTN